MLEFAEFCSDEGIRLTRTVLGKVRQNKFAGRMKRTLNERARSMRIHAGCQRVVNTVTYLINRGPSVPLGFKIPEVWSGKEVNLSHLRTFRCATYVHVDPEKRDKLDAKVVKFYFIGYGSDQLGYGFWDDINRKILRHCDVTFDEIVLYMDMNGVSYDDTEKVGVRVEL